MLGKWGRDIILPLHPLPFMLEQSSTITMQCCDDARDTLQWVSHCKQLVSPHFLPLLYFLHTSYLSQHELQSGLDGINPLSSTTDKQRGLQGLLPPTSGLGSGKFLWLGNG